VAHDPYKAPSAPVGDQEAAEDAAPAPEQVRLACRILWVTLLLSAATLHPSVRGEWWLEGAEGTPEVADAMLVGGLVMSAVFFGFVALVVFLTRRGHYWARWILLALLAFGWLMGLYDLPRSLGETPGAALADLLITAAEVWACYLLFLSPGATWFRQSANRR
jgi:hypothetical protein